MLMSTEMKNILNKMLKNGIIFTNIPFHINMIILKKKGESPILLLNIMKKSEYLIWIIMIFMGLFMISLKRDCIHS